MIADLRARNEDEDSDEVDTAVDDNNNKRTLGVFWNLWCPYSPFSGGHRRRSAPGRRMD